MKLVDISTIPNVIIDLRYASPRNITGRTLYSEYVARLDGVAADQLAVAALFLRCQNLRLVVWDAYRPPAVQRQLRFINSDNRYVLEESNHVKGIAVDVTLARNDGTLIDMGTDHDDFTSRAHADATNVSIVQKANRQLLRAAMEQAGFTQWPYEWWHYDFIR